MPSPHELIAATVDASVVIFRDNAGNYVLDDRRNERHCILPSDANLAQNFRDAMAGDFDNWMVEWHPGSLLDDYPEDADEVPYVLMP